MFVRAASYGADCLVRFARTAFRVIVNVAFIAAVFLTGACRYVAAFFLHGRFATTFVGGRVRAASSGVVFDGACDVKAVACFVCPFGNLTCLVALMGDLYVGWVYVYRAWVGGIHVISVVDYVDRGE